MDRERHAARHVQRVLTHPFALGWIIEQRDDRPRQAFLASTRLDEQAVVPVGQPLLDSADVERDGGSAERRGVETHQPERLGPQARNGRQETSAVHSCSVLGRDPPGQLDLNAERRREAAPGFLLRSIASHDQPYRPAEQPRRTRRGGDEDMSALERRHSPRKEHRVGLAASRQSHRR